MVKKKEKKRWKTTNGTECGTSRQHNRLPIIATLNAPLRHHKNNHSQANNISKYFWSVSFSWHLQWCKETHFECSSLSPSCIFFFLQLLCVQCTSTFGFPRRVTFAGVEHGLFLLDLGQREAWEDEGWEGSETLKALRASNKDTNLRKYVDGWIFTHKVTWPKSKQLSRTLTSALSVLEMKTTPG